MKLNTEFMREVFISSLGGVPPTLKLTFITLLVSLPIAFLMAQSRAEKRNISGKIITAYVSVIRGTPVVLQILFLYSLLPSFLNYFIKSVLHLDFNIFKVNPVLYAFIVFILNNTAVLSEVFRSSLMTVNHGQMEAALSIGLSKRQAYVRIIIPQTLVAALPNICNSTVSLLKSTSLAFMMSVQDITAIAKVRAANGYNYIEAYLVIAVIYIIVCTSVQILFNIIEARLSSYKKLISN
ncbi:MAG: amino acid ABC transporter permease [Lachnospiraceae bacterium]|nr:amino acid ABC transporter permease [Lachnospiraceae bacterium]